MITVFQILTQACGFSQQEAADFLGVRPDTVKSWASGRRKAPQKVLVDLAALLVQIDKSAAEALAQIDTMVAEHDTTDEIDLGVASDNTEARTIGWPSVGAQCTSLALVIARGMTAGYRFRVSPRGSTPATAAAIDAYDRDGDPSQK
jgi:transcriptional regulator with XRE-family HTH domain